MANTIRIKRRASSGASGAPSSLANAELAFNEADRVLYYGWGDNGALNASQVIAIGGSGAFVDNYLAQNISGQKTFVGGLLSTATVPVGDSSNTVATTSWVASKIASVSAGVTTFGTNPPRSGNVVLTEKDITDVLGFKPVVLPAATSTTLGGVKVGSGLSMSVDGILSASVQTTGLTSFNTRTGPAITLLSSDVTNLVDSIYIRATTADSTYLKLSGGTVAGALVINGDLTVNGVTTTVNATNLDVSDKNISLGKVATPTDATANGGGITLLGTTNKTIAWDLSTNGWQFSESIDVASTKAYKVAGTQVLDATTLGAGVINSSLTKVGTVTTGTWNATTVGVAYGGTGAATFTSGALLKGNGTSPVTSAIAGTDYLSPASTIDGGTY